MKRTRKSDTGEKQKDTMPSVRVIGKDSNQPTDIAPGIQYGSPGRLRNEAAGFGQSQILESPATWDSHPIVNGVPPAKHQNGLSPNGEAADFDNIIQLSSHSGSGNISIDKPANSSTILAFDEGDPFLMKGGAMKTHHVTEVL